MTPRWGYPRIDTREDNEHVRLPHASSLIVALTMFVAVATVAAVVSQLAPVDRAGAVLPVAPITSEPTDSADATATPLPDAGGGASDPVEGDLQTDSNPGTADGSGATVVTPAPAEPIAEPEPSVVAPGNSGNAPGHGGATPANENGNSNGKP